MWTKIQVSAYSDCMELTYPYCKLQTIPSPLELLSVRWFDQV